MWKVALIALLGLFLAMHSSIAQSQPTEEEDDPYFEVMYDEPYGIDKFFLKIQPAYADVFTTNVNAGFGLEAQYFLENKWDFRVNFRKTYGRATDIAFDVAERTNSVQNKATAFDLIELGANFHLVDLEFEHPDKISITSAEEEPTPWKSNNRELKVDAKRREVVGMRVGAFFYNTTTDINRALDKQGVELSNANGTLVRDNLTIFGMLRAQGGYFGASYSNIRNYALKFADDYKPAGNDLIFTAYADILVGANIKIEDILYLGEFYSTDVIKTNPLGFRVGAEGMFNRKLGWAYGSEMGYRPSIKKKGFYFMVKIAIPVFGLNFEKKVDPLGI